MTLTTDKTTVRKEKEQLKIPLKKLKRLEIMFEKRKNS